MPQAIAPHTHIYAVITGDIVGSTKLSPGEMADVRGTVMHTVREFANGNSEAISKGVEFFQGDSWQVLLKDPRAALRLTLLIQAKLLAEYGVETRAAIGIGTVARIERNAAISTGEAFTLSGRALETMTGYFGLTGDLPTRASDFALWFTACLRLCSPLERSWTRRQAEVMGLWLSLRHPTHENIAADLDPPVTKQSVTDILSSANWRYFYEAIKAFQATDWQSLLAPEQVKTGENDGLARDRQKRLSSKQTKGSKA